MSERTLRTITVNQIGYPVDGEKIAVFSGSGHDFRIVNVDSGDVVFEGVSGAERFDEASGVTVHTGDFSEVSDIGRYRIEQGEGIASASFIISDKPYHELQQGLLKAFYYYRCGVELTEEYAGDWKHKACHTAEGIVYGQTELRLDCSGGWHDAGDYGKALINQC